MRVFLAALLSAALLVACAHAKPPPVAPDAGTCWWPEDADKNHPHACVRLADGGVQ